MAKAVTEIAVGAALIGASFAVPGSGIAIAGLTIHASMFAAMGASAVMGGIAAALPKNQGGVSMATTSPIAPWQIVYGVQKVGGFKVFEQSNNSQGTSNDDQLHRVYALASHPCQINAGLDIGETEWALRIDGKPVLMEPSGSGYVSYTPTQYTDRWRCDNDAGRRHLWNRRNDTARKERIRQHIQRIVASHSA
jgi:hypothetical protein